ncbi:DUF512 domain-containing protein [Halanaerobaculum tunisiense]
MGQQEVEEINSYLEIEGVTTGSIADELDLKPGDKLIRINGQPIKDFIDYKFLLTDTYVELEVITHQEEYWVLEVEKEYDQKLGIEFSDIIFDQLKTCANNCIFCFIDQSPPQVRETLYLKDDDYRFSFLSGSYVTLTNLSAAEFDRIKRLHLSPLNISVHSTNPKVRCKMLNNDQAGNILEQIEELVAAGIKLNTQIVLCPGINDGQYLEETIRDLGQFAPAIKSLAIVPVGLTKFRTGLAEVRSFTCQEAKEVVGQVQSWQEKFRAEAGFSFVYLADEFYFLAEEPIPPANQYDEFLQLENGVGMVQVLWDQFDQLEDQLPASIEESRQVSLVTSVLGSQALRPLVVRLNQITNLEVTVIEVENSYYGSQVTVTGLLTGQDILAALDKVEVGDLVLLPEVLLNDDNLFLDDLSWSDFKDQISSQILSVSNQAKDLVKQVLGKDIGGGSNG